jgi:hypothetical protein
MSRFKREKVIEFAGQPVLIKPMSFETFGKISEIRKHFAGVSETDMDIKFGELAGLVQEVIISTTDIVAEDLPEISAMEQMTLIGKLSESAEKEAEKKIETPTT